MVVARSDKRPEPGDEVWPREQTAPWSRSSARGSGGGAPRPTRPSPPPQEHSQGGEPGTRLPGEPLHLRPRPQAAVLPPAEDRAVQRGRRVCLGGGRRGRPPAGRRRQAPPGDSGQAPQDEGHVPVTRTPRASRRRQAWGKGPPTPPRRRPAGRGRGVRPDPPRTGPVTSGCSASRLKNPVLTLKTEEQSAPRDPHTLFGEMAVPAAHLAATLWRRGLEISCPLSSVFVGLASICPATKEQD